MPHVTLQRIGAALALGTAAILAPAAQAQPARPNIVFLLTDDQRADTLGCAGNAIIQTPNIDGLAAEGTRFQNAFVTTAICMVSRASILSGLYKGTHGIDRFDQSFIPAQFAETYPVRLRGAGYYTGFIGKWGVGNEMPEQAFDVWNGFPGQGVYFHERNGEQVHVTNLMAEQAEAFIAEAPAEQPFCLSISFKAPHTQDEDPRQFLYDPALESLYANVELPYAETATDAFFQALPAFIQNSEGRVRWKRRFATPEMYQTMTKGYYRLIAGVDLAVARVIAALEARGLRENTVIVFSSDNGFYLGERGLAGKWLMHEESIRVPLIIVDPRLPKAQRGQVRSDIALNIDLAPTVLDYAGLKPAPQMQGRSLRPLVEGATPAWRTEFYYEHHFASAEGGGVYIPATEGVWTPAWKYIAYPGADGAMKHEEFYRLAADPHETKNLINAEASQPRVAAFRKQWAVWRDAVRGAQGSTDAWNDPAPIAVAN
ncbi:MAG: sulfatase [Candidatus Hydrogenedentes bacterium]|nr:sulfatase [Candidatus Hydrogenedentota bacterium]